MTLSLWPISRVISTGSMLLSPSSIVKFKRKNSEVAIAAYVGLKVKYKIPRTTKYKTGNYFLCLCLDSNLEKSPRLPKAGLTVITLCIRCDLRGGLRIGKIHSPHFMPPPVPSGWWSDRRGQDRDQWCLSAPPTSFSTVCTVSHKSQVTSRHSCHHLGPGLIILVCW